jgi:hypothetical protein
MSFALSTAQPFQVFDLLTENAHLRARQRFIWGVVFALALHGLLAWLAPHLPKHTFDPPASSAPIVVRLNTTPEVKPTPPTAEPTPLPAETPPPLPRQAPPILATPPRPGSTAPTIPIQPPPEPTPIEVPAARPETRVADPKTDMFAAIQARRAERETQAAAARGQPTGEPSDEQRRQAAVARNVASLGSNYGGTSGVFEILSKGTRYATFSFRGWKSNANKNWRQIIEVDAGPGGDIELAMIRRMIELIREHYKEDFNWESQRLGRVVVLSARPADTSGLEAFLMREFFQARG